MRGRLVRVGGEMRVIAIPHCESVSNAEKRIQGQLDSPLSDEGVKQSRELCNTYRDVSFGLIFSSDLSRCVMSATPLASQRSLNLEVCAELRGRNYGSIQGMTYKNLFLKLPELYEALKSRSLTETFSDPLHKGETLEAFHERAIRAVLGCVKFAKARPLREITSIAIIVHGGVLESLVRHSLSIPIGVQFKDRLWNKRGCTFTVCANNKFTLAR